MLPFLKRVREARRPRCTALVAAAGSSRRMGGVNKLLQPLEGVPVLVRKEKAAARKASQVFERLLAAGERLLAIIRRSEGGANKDLAKFADQIHSLCDKWDR